MKTIKIKKSFRNGSKLLFIIVPDNYSDYEINESVEVECDKDQSGQSYGYDTDWEIETDIDVITKVLNDKISYNNYKSENLKLEKINLYDYLNDINISKLDKNPL